MNNKINISPQVIEMAETIEKDDNPFKMYGLYLTCLQNQALDDALYALFRLAIMTDIKNNDVRNKELFGYFVNLGKSFMDKNSAKKALGCFKLAEYLSEQLCSELTNSYKKELCKLYDYITDFYRENGKTDLVKEYQNRSIMILQEMSDNVFFSKVGEIKKACLSIENDHISWEYRATLMKKVFTMFEELLTAFPYQKYKRLYKFNDFRDNVIIAYYLLMEEITDDHSF